MSRPCGFSIAAVKTAFCEEIAAVGGNVSDTFADETRLFMRSILPETAEVGLNDGVQGGVALRITDQQLWVHPYVFRQICRNGAIRAQAFHSKHIDDLDLLAEEEICEAVRAAIQSCCLGGMLDMAVDEMRSAQDMDADMFLSLMPILSHLRSENGAEFLSQIIDRFTDGRDRSRFGLMNAVTSVARDTRDPDLRWRLEELGGGIPVARKPTPSPVSAAVELFAVR